MFAVESDNDIVNRRKRRIMKELDSVLGVGTMLGVESSWNAIDQDCLEKALKNIGKIFIPLNIDNNHWTLAVLLLEKRTIEYYDSFWKKRIIANGANPILQKVLSFAKCLFYDQTMVWTHEFKENIPYQDNNYDCGIFVIKYAEYLSLDKECNFEKEKLATFRKEIGADILRLYIKN
jgi:sentrin-specific protease 1